MKSKYSYGGKTLDTLNKSELLGAVEAMWCQKNEKIAELEATIKAYEALLKSNLPIHSLWRSFAENSTLIICLSILGYLVGVSQ
jgi:hypothetical protein